MKVRLGDVNPKAEGLLPPAQPDGSDCGVNYVDAYVKAMKTTLEDGRKVLCTRRGLKLTLEVGKLKGEGLLRRLEHGPDPRVMLRRALAEASDAIDVEILEEDGAIWLELV
jgi:hypothetical protein